MARGSRSRTATTRARPRTSGVCGLSIAPATPDDIPALAALKRAVAARTYSRTADDEDRLAAWLDTHCGEAHFRYRLARPSLYSVFLARDVTGRPVGVATFRQRGERADLGCLYVLEEGRGIGRRLASARDSHARAAGCRRARVWVHRTNERARAFVCAQGYERLSGRSYRESELGVMVDCFERDLDENDRPPVESSSVS